MGSVTCRVEGSRGIAERGAASKQQGGSKRMTTAGNSTTVLDEDGNAGDDNTVGRGNKRHLHDISNLGERWEDVSLRDAKAGAGWDASWPHHPQQRADEEHGDGSRKERGGSGRSGGERQTHTFF